MRVAIEMESTRIAVTAERPRLGECFRSLRASPRQHAAGRWTLALLISVAVQGGGALAFWGAGASQPQRSLPANEPPVVFLASGPPARAARAEPRVQMMRQARTTRARPLPRTDRLRAPAEIAPLPEVLSPPVEEAPVDEGEVEVAGVADVVGARVDGPSSASGTGAGGSGPESALELAQVARAPAVLSQVAPRYPQQAKSDGVEGVVLLRVVIGVDGSVEPEHTRVIRSVPGLDEAAISAANAYRFRPALGHDGRPARVRVDIPFKFSLR